MQPKTNRQDGLTLLEVIITLVVALAMTGYAVPQWSRLVASNRQTATVNQIIGAVQFARSKSIALHRDVVLCPDRGDGFCAASGDTWPSRFLVFVDEERGPPYQLLEPAQILLAGTLPDRMSVHANRDAFVFRPLSVRSSNGTVRVCDPDNLVPPAAVIVSVTGRPRSARRLAGGGAIPCPG